MMTTALTISGCVSKDESFNVDSTTFEGKYITQQKFDELHDKTDKSVVVYPVNEERCFIVETVQTSYRPVFNLYEYEIKGDDYKEVDGLVSFAKNAQELEESIDCLLRD